MEEKSLASPRKLAPGPGPLGLIQLLLKVAKDPFGGLLYIRDTYGDIARINFPFVAHLISHPDHMKHVFRDNSKNYMMRGKEFFEIQPVLGNGVLLSHGELWVRQRRSIAAEFTLETSKSYAPTMLRHTENLVEKWKNVSEVKMTEEILYLTLQIAGESFFGTTIENAKVIEEACTINADLASRRIRSPIKLPRTWPLPSHRKADAAIKRVDEIVYKLINQYKAKPDGRVNVLSRLIAAQQKFGADVMTDKLLRDEIVTLLITGHETTASVLFWTIYCLCTNPDVDAKLAKEIHETIGDKAPTVEDLEKIPYGKKVIQETLRLYPALANLSKEVKDDDVIDGHFIPAGSLMNVCLWLTHRHPDFWDNPEKFDPSRFDEEEVAKRHPYAFVPFGKGPRACVGEHFSMLEAQLILIRLVQNYRFSLSPNQHVVPGAKITTFPLGTVMMKVEKRS